MERAPWRSRGGRLRCLLVLAVAASICAAGLGVASPASAAEPPFTLKVQIGSFGFGHAVVKVNGETCSSEECEYSFAEVKEVTLLAEPAAEWRVAGWFGNGCSSTSAECRFKIEANTNETPFLLPITPEPPVITSPQENQLIESAAGEVKLEFEDPDSRAKGFLCGIDFEPETSCEPEKGVIYTGLSRGVHHLSVSALNAEGYSSFPTTVYFEIVIPSSGTEGGGESQPPPPTLSLGSSGGEGGSRTAHLARLRARWKVSGDRTRVRELLLSDLAPGERVAASCRGVGCGFKRRLLRASGGSLNLTGLLGRHPLGAGAVLELHLRPPGSPAQLFEVKIRSGKQPRILRR